MERVCEIDIRPHVGIKEIFGGGFEEVRLAQDQVFINGARVGYVGLNPGDPLCLIRPLDQQTLGEVKAKIASARSGKEPGKVSTAPTLQAAEDRTAVTDE